MGRASGGGGGKDGGDDRPLHRLWSLTPTTAVAQQAPEMRRAAGTGLRVVVRADADFSPGAASQASPAPLTGRVAWAVDEQHGSPDPPVATPPRQQQQQQQPRRRRSTSLSLSLGEQQPQQSPAVVPAAALPEEPAGSEGSAGEEGSQSVGNSFSFNNPFELASKLHDD